MQAAVRYRGRRVEGLGYLGAALSPTSTAGSAAAGLSVGAAVGGASAAAIGAATGSAVGPIGTAVGALVGVVVGILTTPDTTASHIGKWDESLANAIEALPSSVAGIGRQMLWNNDSNGMTQMLEALLACGVWMSWDPSLISSYDVCAHWAMTYAAAAQTVATAVCKNKPGASVTVQVSNQPGMGSPGPGPFTFKNPDITTGPEAVAAAVIMGPSGVVHWMLSRVPIAGTPALSAQYATQTSSNQYAQKVFACMVDYIAAQTLTADVVTPPKPVPDVTPAISNATTAVKGTVAAVGTVAAPVAAAKPVVVSIPASPAAAPTVTPVSTPAATATCTVGNSGVTLAQVQALIADAQSQGASSDEAASSALSTLQSSGVDTSDPAVQSAVASAAAPSLSTNEILLGVGVLGALWYFFSRK